MKYVEICELAVMRFVIKLTKPYCVENMDFMTIITHHQLCQRQPTVNGNRNVPIITAEGVIIFGHHQTKSIKLFHNANINYFNR